MTYNFVFYDNTNTLISDSNPIAFGRIDPGVTSPTITIRIWNDKDNEIGADTALNPRLYAVGAPDNVDILWNGTILNGYHSMMEARSCRATNVAADQQTAWTPIGPNETLVVGDMPVNSMREIELRLRIPPDADEMSPSKSWQLRITA